MSDLSTLTDEQPQVLTPRTLGGLKIQQVKETQPTFNVLIYGHSGVGKTRLAGSASLVPEMAPVLFVDIEGGTFSIRDLYPDIDVIRIDVEDGFRQVQTIYDNIESGKTPYRTVVLDSLTEMQKFSMYDIMKGVVRKDSERDPDIPSVREWGKNIEQIRRTVRGFRDLPINTVFTALVSEDKQPLTGKVEKKPYLSGKLAHEVAGFLDMVLYYYVKFETKAGEKSMRRLLLTQKTEDTVAKDRSDKLPIVVGLEEPINMQTLYDYIFGTKASA